MHLNSFKTTIITILNKLRTTNTNIMYQDFTKYFHIQLVEGGEYIIKLATSLCEVMIDLTGDYNAKPFAHFTTPYK